MAKETLTGAALVRLALESGVEKPKEIAEWIKAEHKTEVAIGTINQAKAAAKKKLAGGNPVAKVQATQAAKGFEFPEPATTNGDISLTLNEISAIKGLLARLGKDGLNKAISVL